MFDIDIWFRNQFTYQNEFIEEQIKNVIKKNQIKGFIRNHEKQPVCIDLVYLEKEEIEDE